MLGNQSKPKTDSMRKLRGEQQDIMSMYVSGKVLE